MPDDANLKRLMLSLTCGSCAYYRTRCFRFPPSKADELIKAGTQACGEHPTVALERVRIYKQLEKPRDPPAPLGGWR